MNKPKTFCPKCVAHTDRIFALLTKGRRTSIDSYLFKCEGYAMDTRTIVWIQHKEGIEQVHTPPENCWRRAL